MATPAPIVEISFEDPLDAPVWQDVSAYLRGFSFKRGRSNELDQPQAGTATVTLDNRARTFDPVYSSGPYYPDVRPERRLRIGADVDTGMEPFLMGDSFVGDTDVLAGGLVTIYLFEGFVESWNQLLNQDEQGQVTLDVSDAFKLFSQTDFIWGVRYSGTFPNETPLCGDGTGNVYTDTGTPHPPDHLSGTRIAQVLDCLGWAAADRDLDPGAVTILGSDAVFSGSNNVHVSAGALTYMLDVADAEGGAMFIDRGGSVRFIDRDGFPEVDASLVWGDGAGEHPYFTIRTEYDDARIYNLVEVSGQLMATVTSSDATSIASYFERSLSRSLLLSELGGSAGTTVRAPELLAKYKDPKQRITQMRPYCDTASDWLAVLDRELMDAITVKKTFTVGSALSQDSRIESIEISMTVYTHWSITWGLSAIS